MLMLFLFCAFSVLCSSLSIALITYIRRSNVPNLALLTQIAQLREDVLPQHNKGYLGMQDLDLTPVSMDRVAFEFLHRFRPGGHFQLVKGYH